MTPSTPTAPAQLGLAWQLSGVTGWGLYGLQLCLELLRRGETEPLLLAPSALLELDPLQRRLMGPALQKQAAFQRYLAELGPRDGARVAGPVAKSLLPGFRPMSAGERWVGAKELGVIFFEDTRIGPEDVERAKRFDRIITGSTWNQGLLEAAGIAHSRLILQGVDPVRFHPQPRRRLPGDPFVIWSGGKLEHRKAQDIVLEAFRRFHARHPDSLLLTAWQNVWPETVKDIARSPHRLGLPKLRPDRSLDVEGWAKQAGLPAGAVVDCGLVPNQGLPALMAAAHCGLFPSRYESGTNLPAMETMAMGIPVILSRNTGHLDLIALGGPGAAPPCLVLGQQEAVAYVPPNMGSEGWGESDVDEAVAHLEALYTDRAAAAALGAEGAAAMGGLRWSDQVGQWAALLAAL